MKFSVISFALVFCTACTSHSKAYFSWSGLTNKQIKNVTLQELSDNRMQASSASGLRLHISLRHSTKPIFTEIWSRIELNLNSIYQDHELPYPGAISNVFSCPEKFRPKYVPDFANDGLRGKGYSLYANDRLVFGACDTSSIHYKAAYLVAECVKQHDYYEIKIFQPPPFIENGIEKLVQEFRCE